MRTIPVKKPPKKLLKQRHKEMYSPAASGSLLLSRIHPATIRQRTLKIMFFTCKVFALYLIIYFNILHKNIQYYSIS